MVIEAAPRLPIPMGVLVAAVDREDLESSASAPLEGECVSPA